MNDLWMAFRFDLYTIPGSLLMIHLNMYTCKHLYCNSYCAFTYLQPPRTHLPNRSFRHVAGGLVGGTIPCHSTCQSCLCLWPLETGNCLLGEWVQDHTMFNVYIMKKLRGNDGHGPFVYWNCWNPSEATFQMRLALLIDLHLLRVWSTGTNPKETDHWSIDFVEW